VLKRSNSLNERLEKKLEKMEMDFYTSLYHVDREETIVIPSEDKNTWLIEGIIKESG